MTNNSFTNNSTNSQLNESATASVQNDVVPIPSAESSRSKSGVVVHNLDSEADVDAADLHVHDLDGDGDASTEKAEDDDGDVDVDVSDHGDAGEFDQLSDQHVHVHANGKNVIPPLDD